ncbi:MAG: protein kinase family protein [Leptolyngbyaceae cyanobacterium SM1_3_5]|nr:protein kinase family protein [Leptolyngbyaceae cyanobacterium SM1_3_5]
MPVRLVDVVNEVRRKASEGTNFVRYPVQMITQALQRSAQERYENIQLPGGEKQQNGDRPTNTPAELTVEAAPVAYSSPVYTGVRQPFIPTESSTTIASHLPVGTPIKSRWNSYTIEACFSTDQNTRLYTGKTRSDEPVLIKEYQLLDYENSGELEERQQAFERLIELNQKIGHGPDFRIVKLIDAIALPKERSCYLITKPINHNTTLETYLAQHGLMSAPQIRELLRQVLESLRFLHTAYRVHFPSGDSERGLPHGNLSLKSLLVRQIEGAANADRQFFIYLSDLELWEHLFYPIASPRFHVSIANHLKISVLFSKI